LRIFQDAMVSAQLPIAIAVTSPRSFIDIAQPPIYKALRVKA
jgi:hypothetical protein